MPWPLLGTSDQTAAALGVAAAARTLSKQGLQYTGRSVRGENGTIAWPPHWAQIAAWYSRGPPAVRARFAAARQVGHRCGSFTRLLLTKKACSPDEKVNCSPQSRQARRRSWYTSRGPPSADSTAPSAGSETRQPPKCWQGRRARSACGSPKLCGAEYAPRQGVNNDRPRANLSAIRV